MFHFIFPGAVLRTGLLEDPTNEFCKWASKISKLQKPIWPAKSCLVPFTPISALWPWPPRIRASIHSALLGKYSMGLGAGKSVHAADVGL